MTLPRKPALPFPDRPHAPTANTDTPSPAHKHTLMCTIWAHRFPECMLFHMCVCFFPDFLPAFLNNVSVSTSAVVNISILSWTRPLLPAIPSLNFPLKALRDNHIPLFSCLALCGPASQVCIALGPWQDSLFERNKGRNVRKGAPLCLIPPLFAAQGRGVVFTVDSLMDWDFSLYSLPTHTTLFQQK